MEIPVTANGKRFAEMHSDGGITTPFFVAPESVVAGLTPSQPLTSQPIYVLVNAQLSPEFQVTQRYTLSVLGRGMSVAIKAASRAAMGVHAGFAQRSGLNMQFTHIDDRFKQSAPGPFDQDYMNALFEFGVRVAKEGSAFKRNPFERPPVVTAERR